MADTRQTGPRRGVLTLGGWFRARILGAPDVRGAGRLPALPEPRAYDVRKQQLPNYFGADDWERCLEYWGYCCAICGRPRGLWHTLAQDHWVPLTSPLCPGTVPSNILPLCHGESGCNNSKGKKEPLAWLESRLGKRRAGRKLKEIGAYFLWAHEQERQRLGCPECGAPVVHARAILVDNRSGAARETGLWQCTACALQWDDLTAFSLENCPACACWMLETRQGYACPRCAVDWTPAGAPGLDWCPGCKRGILERLEEDGEAWWQCLRCGKEWVDDVW